MIASVPMLCILFWCAAPPTHTYHRTVLVVKWWVQSVICFIALVRELPSFSETRDADGSIHRFGMCVEWVFAECVHIFDIEWVCTAWVHRFDLCAERC